MIIGINGKAGVGKSSIIKQCFEDNKINHLYFSGATLDPWVDFVGIPKEKETTSTDGKKTSYIELVRPKYFEQDEVEAIFIDELNKYASSDIPKNSPILRQLIDIAERGRSLGIILFSAEQFRSVIYDRVTGNCSTHAYGRTNAIEISKKDYQFIPNVYKNMMTRLKQGEYIIQNPIFRSVLKIKFPKPVYKQFK